MRVYVLVPAPAYVHAYAYIPLLRDSVWPNKPAILRALLFFCRILAVVITLGARLMSWEGCGPATPANVLATFAPLPLGRLHSHLRATPTSGWVITRKRTVSHSPTPSNCQATREVSHRGPPPPIAWTGAACWPSTTQQTASLRLIAMAHSSPSRMGHGLHLFRS